MRLNSVLAASTVAAAFAVPVAAADMAYPENFRSFAHVTTGVVTPGFVFNGVDLGAQVPGLHNIYANPAALQSFRRLAGPYGGPQQFNDGAVLVFDLWEPGTLVSGSGSFTFQKQRLAVAVMQKDSKKYADTGGWGFQVFAAGSRTPLLDPAAQQQCFACHQITPNTDFVFSRVSD